MSSFEKVKYEDVQGKCKVIIHGASLATAGVGVSPLPGSDAPAIMALQAAMIVALGQVFGVSLSKASAMAVVKSALAKKLGITAVGQLAKFIPVFGSGINAAIAGGLTEVLGWETVREYSGGYVVA